MGGGVVGRGMGSGVRSQGGVQGMQGPGQRGEGAHARSVFVGWRLQIVGSEPDKKLILSFFGAGRVPGRGRQRPGMDWPSGLGGVVRSRAQGAGVVGVGQRG